MKIKVKKHLRKGKNKVSVVRNHARKKKSGRAVRYNSKKGAKHDYPEHRASPGESGEKFDAAKEGFKAQVEEVLHPLEKIKHAWDEAKGKAGFGGGHH